MTAYVGIDLSLTSTGLAAITDSGFILHRIETKPTKNATLRDRWERQQQILRDIAANIDYHDPLLVAIEGPSLGQSRQAGAHDRSGLWWAVVGYLHDIEVAMVEIPPATRAKYATGIGNANKDKVLAAVIRRYPQADVTGNDVADALILAAIAARLDGHPVEESLPQTHLRALEKLTAPELARAGAR